MQDKDSGGCVNGIHHLGMSVPDLDAARAFYVDLLGLREVFEAPIASPMMDLITDLKGVTGRVMMLATANLFLEIFEFATPTPDPAQPNRPVNTYGFTHIGLDVDDAEAVAARLAQAGIGLHCPVQTLSAVKAVYLRDPFGNVLELQQIIGEGRVPRLPRIGKA